MGFIRKDRFHVCFLVIFFISMAELASQANSRRLILQDTPMHDRFEKWAAENGRAFKDDEEKAKRFLIFKESVQYIESFNKNPDRTFNLSVNQFADLTNEEFKASRNKLKTRHFFSNQAADNLYFRYKNFSDAPSSVDWREKGAVTPIKDQGQCGCCWAFSVVAAMEGITKLKAGQLISLSEQELVDCDTTSQNQGCDGGLMDDAFKFIIRNHGLTTEANYPYEAADGDCNTNKEAVSAATITGYEDVPENSETALEKAVANQPVSVAIDAGGSDFQFYSSGVFSGRCGTELDHAVAAIGYGVSDDGKKYWLVKNSWGRQWGEDGYIKMLKDVDAREGTCGIAMSASYPTA